MFYAGFREFSYRTKHATKHAGKGEGKGAGSVLRPTPRSRVFYWYIHKDRVTGGNRPIFYAGFASFSIVQSTETKKAVRQQRQDAGSVLCLTPVLRAFISYGRAVAGGNRPTFYIGIASFPIVRKESRSGELAPRSIPVSRVFLSYGRAVAGENGPTSMPFSRVFLRTEVQSNGRNRPKLYASFESFPIVGKAYHMGEPAQ